MGDVPHQLQHLPGGPTDFQRSQASNVPAGAAVPTSQAGYPYTQTTLEYPSGFMPMIPPHGTPQKAFSSQLEVAQGQGASRTTMAGPYNMSAMTNALPQGNYRQFTQGQQTFNNATPSPAMSGPGSIPTYGTQAEMPAMSQQYYMSQHAHMPQYYTSPLSAAQQNTAPCRAGPTYYSSSMSMTQQAHHPAHFYCSSVMPYSSHGQGLSSQVVPAQCMPSANPSLDPRLAHAQLDDQNRSSPSSSAHGIGYGDARPNLVRGPPRKPKQSGHAIWIGNLPPQTDLMSLVHHVCKESVGLESLFLISKSNCAFANFKDEPSCVKAQQQLHESRYQSVRLVSRLRKSTVEGVQGQTAPTGPAAGAVPTTGVSKMEDTASDTGVSEAHASSPLPLSEESNPPPPPSDGSAHKDKFYILKSLTVEDLELSVRTNVWATQSHNEEALKRDFQAAENVYLIFSANKSGEYFGYARMASQIDEDPAAAIEFAPAAQNNPATSLGLPKAIPTEATEHAPKGRIIDDSARGTIFWEAERPALPAERPHGDEDAKEAVSGRASAGGDAHSERSDNEGAGGEASKAWGKPFRVEWLSTARLPFYRTRGLRNPWNSNREVKIARDGTELEPAVGRRLIGLFNRVQSPDPAAMPGMPPSFRATAPMVPGSMPMMPGYPVMQPPFSR